MNFINGIGEGVEDWRWLYIIIIKNHLIRLKSIKILDFFLSFNTSNTNSQSRKEYYLYIIQDTAFIDW